MNCSRALARRFVIGEEIAHAEDAKVGKVISKCEIRNAEIGPTSLSLGKPR